MWGRMRASFPKQIGQDGVSVVLDETGPDATVLSWLRAANASNEDLVELGWQKKQPLGAKPVGKGFSGGPTRDQGKQRRASQPQVYATSNVSKDQLSEEVRLHLRGRTC